MHIKSFILFSFLCFAGSLNTAIAADAAAEMDGRALSFDRNKGNCLACHAIPNDPKATSPGDIGPALIGMKARFPDRAKLRAHLWDATVINPKTAMPPFGRNKILTEAELDRVVDYILTM